jgi:Reverse transcriptase (RNA-dependent DNA polymerase)
VCKLVNVFYYNQLDISKLNLVVIYLIPKKKKVNLITNYRPISLINYSFKIISKLLVDRLTLVMDSLIDQTQTAYIKGRLIMDNVVCAHEVLHKFTFLKLKDFFLRLTLKKFLIGSIGISFWKYFMVEVLVLDGLIGFQNYYRVIKHVSILMVT